jgi:hypothetical protein
VAATSTPKASKITLTVANHSRDLFEKYHGLVKHSHGLNKYFKIFKSSKTLKNPNFFHLVANSYNLLLCAVKFETKPEMVNLRWGLSALP